MLVPTMINVVLHHSEVDSFDVSSLRTLIYAAAPMPVELLKQGLSKWGQIFVHGYGMTETAPILTILPKSDHLLDGTPQQLHRLSSCGKQVLGVEVRVVNTRGEEVKPGEIGEIIACGPNVMLGYWRQPEATTTALSGGWMHTGDLATVDEEHYLYIVDRAKDMIISGGENIYSVEVENALAAHPAITEVAVIGRSHHKWGEVPIAVVALRASELTLDDITEFLNDQLARYKHPKGLEIVESLPRNPSGKILKAELRELFAQTATSANAAGGG